MTKTYEDSAEKRFVLDEEDFTIVKTLPKKERTSSDKKESSGE
jgi:hypothetical protein